MDEIKFKITLKVNDLYYFMMHHYYSKPAGIIGLVLSLGSLVLLITRWNVTDAAAKMLYFIIAVLFTVINPLMLRTKAKAQIQRNKSLGGGRNIFCQMSTFQYALEKKRRILNGTRSLKSKITAGNWWFI